MFDSIYSEQLSQYYGLRQETLSESAGKHELCYLRRFDSYVSEQLDSPGHITEDFINGWVGSLSGKSSSVENEIIVIRQFLEFLKHAGESVAMPYPGFVMTMSHISLVIRSWIVFSSLLITSFKRIQRLILIW